MRVVWLLAGALALCAVVLAVRVARAPDVLPPVVQVEPARPVVDSAANCETIRTRYRAALAPLQRCSNDDECVAERRDGVRSGIDGCVRFRRSDAKVDALVDPLAEAWVARGCAQTFMTCSERRAQCTAGVCAERPPEPIPPSWRRFIFTSSLAFSCSFFIPPDVVPAESAFDDDEGGRLEGPRYELVYEYGKYSPALEAHIDEGETLIRRESTTISGAAANIIIGKRKGGDIWAGVQVPQVPLATSGKSRLSVWATCKTLKACAEIETIVRSIEFH